MYLLNATDLRLESFGSTQIPRYAILSHTWTGEEVTFDDIVGKDAHKLAGHYKVKRTCEQALKDGFSHVWIDSCCIDKSSSTELSEAINSMYRWYQDASICYAYLSDVQSETQTSNIGRRRQCLPETPGLRQSRWFKRGWTLQELLAPHQIRFYDVSWLLLGTKQGLAKQISDITKIPQAALKTFKPDDYSIASRMSWAAARQTTRLEDRAYSLMGIFDVNMPLIYGEGLKAFLRLQEEIMKSSNDTSVFLWSGDSDNIYGMLAATPDSFAAAPYVLPPGPSHHDNANSNQYTFSKSGVSGLFHLYHYVLDIFIASVGTTVDRDDIIDVKTHCIFLQQVTLGTYRRISIRGNSSVELDGSSIDENADYGMKQILIERCPSVDRRVSHFPTSLWNASPAVSISGAITKVIPGVLYPKGKTLPDEDPPWTQFQKINDDEILRIHVPEIGNPFGCIFLDQDPGLVLFFHRRLLQDGTREPAVIVSKAVPTSLRHNGKVSKHHMCCEAGCVKLLSRATAPPGVTHKLRRLAMGVARSQLNMSRYNEESMKKIRASSKVFTIGKAIQIYLNKSSACAMCFFNMKSSSDHSRRPSLTFPRDLDQRIWIFNYKLLNKPDQSSGYDYYTDSDESSSNSDMIEVVSESPQVPDIARAGRPHT